MTERRKGFFERLADAADEQEARHRQSAQDRRDSNDIFRAAFDQVIASDRDGVSIAADQARRQQLRDDWKSGQRKLTPQEAGELNGAAAAEAHIRRRDAERAANGQLPYGEELARDRERQRLADEKYARQQRLAAALASPLAAGILDRLEAQGIPLDDKTLLETGFVEAIEAANQNLAQPADAGSRVEPDTVPLALSFGPVSGELPAQPAPMPPAPLPGPGPTPPLVPGFAPEHFPPVQPLPPSPVDVASNHFRQSHSSHTRRERF